MHEPGSQREGGSKFRKGHRVTHLLTHLLAHLVVAVPPISVHALPLKARGDKSDPIPSRYNLLPVLYCWISQVSDQMGSAKISSLTSLSTTLGFLTSSGK